MVVSVISGLVDAFATLQANPLADTTETSVTVPQLVVGIYLSQLASVESATSIFQSLHTGSCTRFVPLLVTRPPFAVIRDVL